MRRKIIVVAPNSGAYKHPARNRPNQPRTRRNPRRASAMAAVPLPLLDKVRERIRLKHYSIRTEQAYVDWIRRFILFHGKRHPAEMGAAEIVAFLTDLAVERNVAAATQNLARTALLFLYREILAIELPWLDGVEHAKRPSRLPIVLTRTEVRDVLGRLEGTHRLLGSLLYGAGLRIMEGVRLRIKDVDFERREIVVRDGKGAKDRVTLLPRMAAARLRAHLRVIRRIHERDLAEGFGAVYLPTALERKWPSAAREWGWQYIFPAPTRSPDPRSGLVRRHHLSDQAFQRAMRQAVRDAGLTSRRRRTRCAIRSRRTCSNPATISGLCKSCLAIRRSARP
jgi:integron integrase